MRPSETPPRAPVALHDAEVADWLDANDLAALLFWDPDDGVSQRLRARLDLAAAAADVPVGLLDARTQPLVARALGVESVPTLVVFRGGAVVDRLMGGAPDAILREVLRPHPRG